MSDPTPRQRATRRRIVDAAIEVFAERGFQGARVADVATTAGVAEGTIYLYFKNKQALLLSIFEQTMDRLLDEVADAITGPTDPMARIRAFAVFHLHQVEHHPAVAELLQIELRAPQLLRNHRPEKLWAYLDVLRGLILEAQKAGQLREDYDIDLALWALFGALDQLATQWMLRKPTRRFSLEEAAVAVANTFLRGLSTRDQLPSTLEGP